MREYAELPAVVSEHATISYGALDEHARRVASYLRTAGVSPGQQVVLLFRNTPLFIGTLVGCAKAQVVPVLVHPGYGWELVSRVATETGAKLIVNDGSAESAQTALRAAEHAGIPAVMASELATARADVPPPRDDIEVPLVILLSSGSSGTPMLAVRGDRAFSGAARRFGECWGATPGVRFVVGSMLTHAAALGWGALAALQAGATLVVPENRSAAGLVDVLASQRPDVLFVVPSQARAMLDRSLATAGARVGRIILGGETLTIDVARALADRFGCEVQNTYGMTEGFCTATDPTSLAEIDRGCVGRPCCDADVLEVRDEHGALVTEGEPGQLWVRGPAVIDRYWDRPARDDRGFFCTGDRVRVIGRDIYLLGREKRVISRGGVKISPEEIEQHVAQHPAIREVAIVSVPSPTLGERVCAVVSSHRGTAAPTLGDLRVYLEHRGVGRLRQPDMIVVLDELAKNPIGKTDLRAVTAVATALAMEET